jgi:hypothetical protein
MKRTLAALAALAVSSIAAGNVENPLYAPSQFGFYSKTAFGWMNKETDDNDAMKAKDWANRVENPIFRIYEDFGFGITNWLALRGSFGYTHAGSPDPDRTGMHQARLGLNFRVLNGEATNGIIWDLYSDAFLSGLAKMKAEVVASKKPTQDMPLSFNYENYGNGRWGVWAGTLVGKTFDKLTIAGFGEALRTFNNDNSEIKLTESAKEILQLMVTGSMMQLGQDQATSAGIAKAYVDGLPSTFSVETKGTWEFSAGLKALYDLNSDWSLGGGFNWKHRGTNSIEKVNIKSASTTPNEPTVSAITSNIVSSLSGSMEDGIDEFMFTLLGSYQVIKNLQLTLYGEYTFDSAERKSQLGTNRKAEAGLRANVQF